VLGEATPSESTLACLISLSPDAIVLDMAVPDALGVARTLRARIPHTKIVAFAVSNVDAEIVTCARAGICGYVHRDGSAADLVTEVLNAVRGELHCSPRMAALLQEQVEYLSRGDLGVNMLNCQPAGMLQSLTERERDILRHVDKGMSNKEIARALKISLATVKNHVHNILEKLQVRRRTEALAYVREQQISPVPRIAG
jgi:DNA-binding NarL/FixJ family response regulator